MRGWIGEVDKERERGTDSEREGGKVDVAAGEDDSQFGKSGVWTRGEI